MNFYRNLGTSKRVGAELEASYNLGKPGVLNASYTQAKYEFENQGVSGDLAGIPKSNFTLEWLYRFKDFDLKMDLKYVNSLYADNNNEVKVPSYLLSNIALKNKFNFGGFFLEVGLHVRNLLDEKYFDNLEPTHLAAGFTSPLHSEVSYFQLKLLSNEVYYFFCLAIYIAFHSTRKTRNGSLYKK